MFIVAIHRLIGDKEKLAAELSSALELTNFEALARLRVPGTGPLIVGVFAESDQAVQLEARLSSRGFSTLTLTTEEIKTEASQRVVRRFELLDQAFNVETTSGERFAIPYRKAEIIVRGTGISSSTSTETGTERKFDITTAIVSSGLKVMKKVKTTREVVREDREGFFNLYSDAGPILVFRENSLVYEALGPSRALSRTANYLQLLAEIRKRCPGVRFDERLLNKAGASALLGPRLNPENHLIIATALLAKELKTN